MRKKNGTGKRLRLIPLILGGYGAFLGFGLVAIGLAEMKVGIGIVRFLAFFEMPKDEFRIYQKSIEPDMAVEWLKQLAAGNPDFSEWECVTTAQPGEEEEVAQMTHWRQLLVIFGESWHDEHQFFSARDVELALEGIHEGKYLKAVLELGSQAVDLFPGVQNDLAGYLVYQ